MCYRDENHVISMPGYVSNYARTGIVGNRNLHLFRIFWSLDTTIRERPITHNPTLAFVILVGVNMAPVLNKNRMWWYFRSETWCNHSEDSGCARTGNGGEALNQKLQNRFLGNRNTFYFRPKFSFGFWSPRFLWSVDELLRGLWTAAFVFIMVPSSFLCDLLIFLMISMEI